MSIVALAASLASPIYADEIRLCNAWGINIAGIRDARELIPPPKQDPSSAEEFINSSVVEQIRHRLSYRYLPPVGDTAGEGFLVPGGGKQALENAWEVLAGKAKPLKQISAGDEASLIVFAYASGRSLRLDDVKHSDGEIVVAYHLNCNELMSSSAHFALIPLPTLGPGKIKLTMQRSADTGPEVVVTRMAKISAERLVSGSFTFKVTDKER
ncbi:hypothetical protein [Lacipirellula sp.]|uniref:hypothetical protein n=1 Tax=Lacipirellula sp. TaxID=2691419 RepID=UPI003D0D584E